MDELRAYLLLSKSFAPSIPEDLTDYVANAYAEMRISESEAAENATVRISTDQFVYFKALYGFKQGYTTARTLLSILRLSTALARLGWSDKVGEFRDIVYLLLMCMCR